MKKAGYDQFFKAAAQTRVKKPAPAPPRKLKNFPFTPLISGTALVAILLAYLARPELMDQLVKHVEVRFIGQVVAEEKPAARKNLPNRNQPAAEKLPERKTRRRKSGAEAKDAPVSEDVSYIEKLRQRKEELDLREKELNQLEEELQRQKVEVDQRIRQLEQIRRDIASHLKERVDADETQVNKLVDLYSSMKPKQAADVIASLQEDLAVQVLGKMKKKNAAEVMNLLPAEKARGLSEKLTGYKR